MITAVSGKNVKLYVVKFLSLVVVGSLFGGCATIISGSRQKVDFISEQEGAKVSVFKDYNNKVFESNTNATARLKRGDGFFSGAEYKVAFSKEGHDTLTTQLQTDLNAWPYIAPNILLGGWLGMLIIDPATGAMWKFKQPIMHADFSTGIITGYTRTDGYFAARYALPLGLPGMGAFNIESGWIWENGTFFGIDFLYGAYEGPDKERVDDDGYRRYTSDESWAIGGGFNLGGIYDLPVENLKLVYGGAVGLWVVDEYKASNVNFLAPFVKLRWNFVELSWRGLLGTHNNNDGQGFGWNNNQISLGVCFESDNRWRGKR